MKKIPALSLISTLLVAGLTVQAASVYLGKRATLGGYVRAQSGEYMTPEDAAEEAMHAACEDAVQKCEQATGEECAISRQRSTFAESGYATDPADYFCWADKKSRVENQD